MVRATYNFSPTLSLIVPRYMARILNRSYDTGRFNLSDIDVHNGFEHDASLVRMLSIKSLQFLTHLTNPASPPTLRNNNIGRDTHHQSDQGLPDGQLVASLLKCATGPPPRVQATESDPPLPPSHSLYSTVAAQVTNAIVNFDMNRTLTPRDLSRRLGARRHECRSDNEQYSLDYRHKIAGSAKFVA
jgi:hypothetical protein